MKDQACCRGSYTTLWGTTDDRGDVPGWVLITLMTAGLVAGIWAIASPILNDLFTQAIAGVTGG